MGGFGASNQEQILYDNKPKNTHARMGRYTLDMLELDRGGGGGECGNMKW